MFPTVSRSSTAFAILACVALATLFCLPSLAQPAAQGTAFELAEVHPTPHTSTPYMTGGMLHGDRYLLHNATMVDMISLAYGLSGDNVLGGPAWLDLDTFDISARAPRGTSPEEVKLMLRALLAERFKLVLHNDTHPLPSYVLRVEKGGPKLKQADEAEVSHIEEHHSNPNPTPGVPAYYSVTSYNRSMPQLVEMLGNFATAYLPKPVVDATGLKGGYDFDLAWTWRPEPGGLTIFEAVEKQLGLKLALEKYPTPVVIVDNVNQKPTPNAPGIDSLLPPPPPAEFDVAVLTPSKPDAPFQGHITGSQINATGMTLKYLIQFAYGLNPNADELIVNAPKFIGQDHWDILAKAGPEAQASGPDGKPRVDFDLLPHMVQTMLAERFQMKSHMEDRPIDAFTLVAANPKMKKADPLNRTACKEGPGPDGKDPRIADPILGRLFYCQNMTMAQFANQIPLLANGYVFTPVLDATGLTGAYDFTLSFSSAGQLHSSPPPTSTQPGAAAAQVSDPNGGLSLQDAIVRQLGVKLEKRRRPVPVLVIDHIEEKPTEN
jgi:uncharacterized protein (TIGR03435 family)